MSEFLLLLPNTAVPTKGEGFSALEIPWSVHVSSSFLPSEIIQKISDQISKAIEITENRSYTEKI